MEKPNLFLSEASANTAAIVRLCTQAATKLGAVAFDVFPTSITEPDRSVSRGYAARLINGRGQVVEVL